MTAHIHEKFKPELDHIPLDIDTYVFVGDSCESWPPALRREHKSMVSELKKLQARWSRAVSHACQPDKERAKKELRATGKLNDLLDKAIFKIEFADCVEEAQSIIESLPSIESLTTGA
jgi:hypothetical protein